MAKLSLKIQGAGLSGLTCAINLARAGYRVSVFEINKSVYPENPQLLPNWFSKKDVIEELEECGIKIPYQNKVEEAEINFNSGKVIVQGSLGYVVLRGGENGLEKELLKQAQEAGVEVINNSCEEPDVIATGKGRPFTVGYGKVYQGSFNPHKVKVFFSSEHTPTVGYGYLFPHNSTKATVKISRRADEAGVDLKDALSDICKKVGVFERDFLYDFGSMRSFEIPETAKRGRALVVGEAAGFQDELFRFGMRYAIISGYLAAKAIIEGLDYDKLWKERFLKEFSRTRKTRQVFEDFKAKGFVGIEGEIRMPLRRIKKLWNSPLAIALLAIYPPFKKIILSAPFIRFFRSLMVD